MSTSGPSPPGDGPATVTTSTTESEDPSLAMGRMGRHTIVYGLGMLLSKAVAFLMLPIYTRYLTPADYGVMELIEMTLDVIAIAAGARIAIGVFRYYHKVETEEEKQAVVSTSLIILAMSYGAVAALTVIAAPHLSLLVFDSLEQTTLIRIAAMSMGFQSLIIAPLAYVRVKDRSTLFVGANLLKLLLGLSLNIVFLVGMGMGVQGVFMSTLISNGLVGTALAVYLVREVGFRFTRSATRDLLRYGVPLMVTQIATFVATFGDRYFLKAAADAAEVGIYSLAYQFGFLLGAVGYAPLAMVWEPARFEFAKRPDRDRVFARAFVYMNLLLWTTAVGIVVFGSDVIRVMADPAFHAAGALIPLIVLAYVFQSWTHFLEVGIHVRERTELITLGNWIAAFVALVGYWFLIPRFLGFGAAAATVIAFAARYWILFAISQRLWRVRYDWRPVAFIVLLSCGAAGTSLLIPADTSLLITLPVRTGIVLLFLVCLWSSGIMLDEERRGARILARSLARRIRRDSPPTEEERSTVG